MFCSRMNIVETSYYVLYTGLLARVVMSCARANKSYYVRYTVFIVCHSHEELYRENQRQVENFLEILELRIVVVVPLLPKEVVVVVGNISSMYWCFDAKN